MCAVVHFAFMARMSRYRMIVLFVRSRPQKTSRSQLAGVNPPLSDKTSWLVGRSLADDGFLVAALDVVPRDPVTVEVVEDSEAVLAALASAVNGLAVVRLSHSASSSMGPVGVVNWFAITSPLEVVRVSVDSLAAGPNVLKVLSFDDRVDEVPFSRIVDAHGRPTIS